MGRTIADQKSRPWSRDQGRLGQTHPCLFSTQLQGGLKRALCTLPGRSWPSESNAAHRFPVACLWDKLWSIEKADPGHVTNPPLSSLEPTLVFSRAHPCLFRTHPCLISMKVPCGPGKAHQLLEEAPRGMALPPDRRPDACRPRCCSSQKATLVFFCGNPPLSYLGPDGRTHAPSQKATLVFSYACTRRACLSTFTL